MVFLIVGVNPEILWAEMTDWAACHGKCGEWKRFDASFVAFFDHRTFLVKVRFLICPTEVCLKDL